MDTNAHREQEPLTKVCIKCQERKLLSLFNANPKTRDRRSSSCTECLRIYGRAHREKTADMCRERAREYYRSHAEERKAYAQQYYRDNKEKIFERAARYRRERYHEDLDKNRKASRDYRREKIASDPQFRFTALLRTRIYNAIATHSRGSLRRTVWRGIDFAQVFTVLGPRPGDGWHLDHVIPLSAFDLTSDEHLQMAHISDNLRWVPKAVNLRKAKSIPWDEINKSEALADIASKTGLTNPQEERHTQ